MRGTHYGARVGDTAEPAVEPVRSLHERPKGRNRSASSRGNGAHHGEYIDSTWNVKNLVFLFCLFVLLPPYAVFAVQLCLRVDVSDGDDRAQALLRGR